MHPNHPVIKKLMTEHVTLTKVRYKLCDGGIMIEDLEDMDLFDIVMDLVGFQQHTARYTLCVRVK